MRVLFVLVVGALLAGACGDKKGAASGGGGGAGDPALAKAAEGLQQDESDLYARRDELARERREIKADRQKLAQKRAEVAASGGDVAAVDQEEQALDAREEQLDEKEAEFLKKTEALLNQYQKLVAAGGGGGGKDDAAALTRREGQMAGREERVAKREDDVRQREKDLARRERELAKREAQMCGGGQVTTIVQQVDPKGSKYTKRDVEPVLTRARKKMTDKGLLATDLPAPAQGLEAEAVKAMKDGDYGKAKFAADQLYATVESTKIDKAFISAKIGRLNGFIKGKSLDADTKKQVDELFRGATADYGDGKFAAANAKLNKIYALVR